MSTAPLPPGAFRAQAGDYPMIVSRNGVEQDKTAFLFFPYMTSDCASWVNARELTCPRVIMGTYDMGTFDAPAESVVSDMIEAVGCRERTGPIWLIGYSVGGFPALLYGSIMASALAPRPVSVLGFSPRVRLQEPDDAAADDPDPVPYVPGRSRPAEQDKADEWVRWAAKCEDASLRVVLLVGERNKRDMRLAGLLADVQGVRIIKLPTGDHNTVLWMTAPVGNRSVLEKALVIRLRDHAKLPPGTVPQAVRQHADAILAFRQRYPTIQSLLEAEPAGT